MTDISRRGLLLGCSTAVFGLAGCAVPGTLAAGGNVLAAESTNGDVRLRSL